MGKFYDALRRSGTLEDRSSPNTASSNVLEIPKDTAKGLTPGPRLSKTSTEMRAAGFGPDPRLVTLLDPGSEPSENFKMLRTKLMVLARERSVRSILITSAEPLDGKSLVAANLAVSIAQSINEYVLLVDCDLRAPTLHRLFNLKIKAGMQEYLKGDTPSVESFLVRTPLEKLTVLPAGSPPPNPSELICSVKMRTLVEELRSRYNDRFVIFDSPPGQFMAETAFLANMVDGILLVVRHGKTPRQLIQNTLENIGRDRVLGIVFNASDERRRDYHYYYQHYRQRKV
jgi:exopolysaccharide/PEP-CTERM locus tyrosine autokinase